MARYGIAYGIMAKGMGLSTLMISFGFGGILIFKK
jgi:hypothetical protein